MGVHITNDILYDIVNTNDINNHINSMTHGESEIKGDENPFFYAVNLATIEYSKTFPPMGKNKMVQIIFICICM
jgi:hypothetical protein